MLRSFLECWISNKHWWFSPTKEFDSVITKRFKHILEYDFDVNVLSRHDIATLCIAYDQLSRHIYRKDAYIIQKYTYKSIDLYRLISDDLSDFHGILLCFLLLPLRHSREQSSIDEATSIVWNRLIDSDLECYRKFLQASYKTLASRQSLIYHPCFAYFTESTHFETIETIGESYFPHDHYIVSLSGGVDSMVASYILSKFAKDKTICIHINYCNRSCTDKEEEFIRSWCSYIGLPLYVRRIQEINRPLCMLHNMRDMYESYTKKVRFECYRCVGDENAHVILGHNKDDCFENILTNINNGDRHENLTGMNRYSTIDDITFFRPLLEIPKKDIVDFAKRNQIPHLPDSTPKWSQRGKIRDIVVPSLNAWDPNAIGAFFQLTGVLKENMVIQKLYVDILTQNVSRPSEGVIQFDCCGSVPTSITVWREVFRKFSIQQPSTKSLVSFCNRLSLNKHNAPFKANISKHVSIQIDSSSNIKIVLGNHDDTLRI